MNVSTSMFVHSTQTVRTQREVSRVSNPGLEKRGRQFVGR